MPLNLPFQTGTIAFPTADAAQVIASASQAGASRAAAVDAIGAELRRIREERARDEQIKFTQKLQKDAMSQAQRLLRDGVQEQTYTLAQGLPGGEVFSADRNAAVQWFTDKAATPELAAAMADDFLTPRTARVANPTVIGQAVTQLQQAGIPADQIRLMVEQTVGRDTIVGASGLTEYVGRQASQRIETATKTRGEGANEKRMRELAGAEADAMLLQQATGLLQMEGATVRQSGLDTEEGRAYVNARDRAFREGSPIGEAFGSVTQAEGALRQILASQAEARAKASSGDGTARGASSMAEAGMAMQAALIQGAIEQATRQANQARATELGVTAADVEARIGELAATETRVPTDEVRQILAQMMANATMMGGGKVGVPEIERLTGTSFNGLDARGQITRIATAGQPGTVVNVGDQSIVGREVTADARARAQAAAEQFARGESVRAAAPATFAAPKSGSSPARAVKSYLEGGGTVSIRPDGTLAADGAPVAAVREEIERTMNASTDFRHRVIAATVLGKPFDSLTAKEIEQGVTIFQTSAGVAPVTEQATSDQFVPWSPDDLNGYVEYQGSKQSELDEIEKQMAELERGKP